MGEEGTAEPAPGEAPVREQYLGRGDEAPRGL